MVCGAQATGCYNFSHCRLSYKRYAIKERVNARTFHARVLLNNFFFVGSHCRMLMMKCPPNRFTFDSFYLFLSASSLPNVQQARESQSDYLLIICTIKKMRMKSIHAKWKTTAVTSLIVFEAYFWECVFFFCSFFFFFFFFSIASLHTTNMHILNSDPNKVFGTRSRSRTCTKESIISISISISRGTWNEQRLDDDIPMHANGFRFGHTSRIKRKRQSHNTHTHTKWTCLIINAEQWNSRFIF